MNDYSYFYDFLNRRLDFGRGYMCFIESQLSKPKRKCRLPRRLKKATVRYMKRNNLHSMVIMPQAQFVCFSSGKLIVCHAHY